MIVVMMIVVMMIVVMMIKVVMMVIVVTIMIVVMIMKIDKIIVSEELVVVLVLVIWCAVLRYTLLHFKDHANTWIDKYIILKANFSSSNYFKTMIVINTRYYIYSITFHFSVRCVLFGFL